MKKRPITIARKKAIFLEAVRLVAEAFAEETPDSFWNDSGLLSHIGGFSDELLALADSDCKRLERRIKPSPI
jgi:hypothetical protein